MKKNVFYASLLASVVLASCSNDAENVVIDSTPQNVAVALNLPKLKSKQVGDAGLAGDRVAIEGEYKLIAKQGIDGPVTNTLMFPASNLISGTWNSVVNISGAATFMDFIGNDDDGVKTNNVNTRQGASTSSAVRVIGGAVINPGTPGSCVIDAGPEMARIEIIGEFGPFSTISNFVVNKIHINNIKTFREDQNPVKYPNAEEPWWSDVFAKPELRSNMYSEINALGIPAGQADGYNIFPQGASNMLSTKEEAYAAHPHIILSVSYIDSEGNQQTEKYLNVVALKDINGNYIQEFEPGMIYQLNLSDLTSVMDVVNPPTTVDPDPDYVNVDVTVNIRTWEVTTVKPEV